MNRISIDENRFKAEDGNWYCISKGFNGTKPVKTTDDAYIELIRAIRKQSEEDQELYETNKPYDGDAHSYNMADGIDGLLRRYNPRIEYDLFCKRLVL